MMPLNTLIVGDWILDQFSKLTPEQQDRLAGEFEAWQERESISQEPRITEPAPYCGATWDNWSHHQRAVFVSHLFQRDDALDKAIARFAGIEQLPSRRVFRKVSA